MRGLCLDDAGQQTFLTKGSIYDFTVDPEDPTMGRLMFNGEPRRFRLNRFMLISEDVKRHNTHKDWKNYEFNIRSKDQIDDSAISRDLSWTNPMMILETEEDNYVKVYLDGTIWDKAYSCGPSEPVDFHGIEIEEHVYAQQLEKYLWCGHREGWVHRRFLPGLIALVKRIKYAEWNKPCKTKCTVRKIKI